jgi:hypothetical protein
MLCQKPQADGRAFWLLRLHVFSVFFYDTVIREDYIAYETLVTW